MTKDMYQLHFQNRKEINPYICKSSNIYFTCILKNEAEGVIWGNRMDSPDFLLVWSEYQEDFQFMGKPLHKEYWGEFRNWFDRTIIPFLKQKGLTCFEYGTDTRELADMFQSIFYDIKIMSDFQKIFYWSKTELALPQPKDYRIVRVDRKLLEEDLTNKEYITDELQHAYGEIEYYFQHGIAYVAIKDRTLVARADMLFCHNGYGNISVNTAEPYRKKGISSYLVMKTIQETCKRGFIPIWDCTEDNIASENTALKCGFHMIRKDIISWFMLDHDEGV